MAEIEKVINRQNDSTTHRAPATYTDGDSTIEEEKERYIIGTCAGTQRKQLGAAQQRVDRYQYFGNHIMWAAAAGCRPQWPPKAATTPERHPARWPPTAAIVAANVGHRP